MRWWRTLAVWGLTTALWTPAACGATSTTPLNDDDADVVARAFAPTLVFHPEERFFPVSPLYPIDLRHTPLDNDPPATALGTPEERVESYDALSRRDQLALATLAYRVFALGRGSRSRIAVEYWCHYVFNDYTFHGGIAWWTAADNHLNDLERIVFVLEAVRGDRQPLVSVDAARHAYAIRRIVASAHDGSVTANVLDVEPARPVYPPVAVLVERGSHAMAPDVDDDGRVTPGVDVNASEKFLWGIRDHGEAGVWYRAAFTDDRSSGVRLCGPDTSPSIGRCAPYALERGDALQAWFLSRQLTPSLRDRIVGRSNWLFRWFGDVNVADLVVPKDPGAVDVITAMTNRRANQEGGMSVGMRLGERTQPLAIGGRWAVETPGRLIPDFLTTADVLVDGHGLAGVEMAGMGFYQLDVITKAQAGVTWTSSPDAGSPKWDVLVGVELRVGRLRVRPNTTVRNGLKGTQVSLVF